MANKEPDQTQGVGAASPRHGRRAGRYMGRIGPEVRESSSRSAAGGIKIAPAARPLPRGEKLFLVFYIVEHFIQHDGGVLSGNDLLRADGVVRNTGRIPAEAVFTTD